MSLFCRVSSFVFHEDFKKIRIISPDRKSVFYLNDFSSFLFLSLDKPKTLNELILLALSEYDVKRDVLGEDIRCWLKESIKSGFIQKTSKKSNFIIDFFKKIRNRVF